jgi:hypothetical protein
MGVMGVMGQKLLIQLAQAGRFRSLERLQSLREGSPTEWIGSQQESNRQSARGAATTNGAQIYPSDELSPKDKQNASNLHSVPPGT